MVITITIIGHCALPLLKQALRLQNSKFISFDVITRHPQGGEGNPPLFLSPLTSSKIPIALLRKSGNDAGVTPAKFKIGLTHGNVSSIFHLVKLYHK